MIDTFFSRLLKTSPEAGDTLIEVMISALLVALIVVATLNGFDETNRVSQDERSHDQATVLAAQSQEQLRSDPATTLNALASSPHEYTQTVGGTIYKITQAAQFVNGSGVAAGCSNSKNETEASKYLEVTSSVDWHTLEAVKRSAVTQSSIITPPDGSGLEVDVTNQGSPEEGVSGVSVLSGGVETTTGTNGCVIYTGIPATTANVEAYRLKYVTPSGEHKIIAKEVSIAPNITTHYHVYLGYGGGITAKFMNQGGPAKGDTFVAFNNKMGVTPEFELGSTKFTYNAEGEYEPLTGTTAGYAETAKTAEQSPYYPNGDLFPFTSAWTVYAGDCTENNPAKYSAGIVKPGEAIVPPGGNVTTNIPTSYLKLNVYKGATGTTPETTPQEVKITNLSCKTEIPQQVADNASKSNYEHRQMTESGGHLEVPYQPFGKFEMCLAYNNSTTHTLFVTNSPGYENKTEAGIELKLNVGATSPAGWTATSTGTTTSKC
jgi:Tfp pilus assembly protein PilV